MPTQEITVRPPRTVMEVFKMLPEGTLAEVIENTLYMSPTPVTKHQRIVSKLMIHIGSFIEQNNSGEIFTAPYDVFLDESANAVQPDILFVSAENASIIDEESTIHGVPDLIIEVLSPGNKKYDQVVKKELYEKFGVKEYWIVDPETRQASGYWLESAMFVSLGAFAGKIHSQLLGHEFEF
jgi:Uma2 family endonuclease